MLRDRDQVVKRPNESDDEVYNEADDEDYNPQQADDHENISSSDDEETAANTKTKKRKATIEDELDSGDEATIEERKTRKRRKHQEEGSDGDGSMIKTRAQRLVEKVERREKKRAAAAGQVTVDVDDLWNELNALPIGIATVNALNSIQHLTRAQTANVQDVTPSAEYITITRRIHFAGQVEEVQERVLRLSEEAQNWLAEQEAQQVKEDQAAENGLARPLRRLSLFEPNPLGIVKGIPPDKLRRRAPSRMDMAMAERRAEDDRKRKAEKLSTMQKTALDWKGFVQEQGIGEELKEYGKSKKGFLAREQFLDQVHGAKEVARRTARLKG